MTSHNAGDTSFARKEAVDSRDIHGFEEFYRANYGSVIRYARQTVTSAEAAIELTQEAFVVALRNWDKFRELENPQAYLRRVVKNLAIDHYRKEHRTSAVGLDPFDTRGPAAAAERADHAGSVDAQVDFTRILSELPERQRDIAYLTFVREMSHAEIAEILGLSPGTVAAHLHRARARIRQSLSDRVD